MDKLAKRNCGLTYENDKIVKTLIRNVMTYEVAI